MNKFNSIQYIFKQVREKCAAEMEKIDNESIYHIGKSERIICSVIVAAMEKDDSLVRLQKVDKKCFIPPRKLDYIDTYCLRLNVFDPLDWKVQDLQNWHGAGIYIPKTVAKKAIRTAIKEFTNIHPPKKGAPRKQEYAQVAYNKFFPNGHGNLSWKEVLTECGCECSVDTLKRSLGVKKQSTSNLN